MTYSIVFSTRTGNTKLLAETIHQTLARENCIYFGYPGPEAQAADRLYVGFWTNRGVCDEDTAAFLKTVKDREIMLFGTAGQGGDEKYFDRIVRATEALLDPSCHVVGTFMCQGKMPESVREKYESMKDGVLPGTMVKSMLDNFDKARSHPDRDDLRNLERMIRTLN